MIFKETRQQVLNGTKRQTRRPVKPNETLGWAHWFETNLVTRAVIITFPDGRTRVKWQQGKTYAIQPGRGKKSIGRIRITKIRRERLQDISFADITAEGVPSEPLQRFAFEQLWNSLYRKPYRWEDDIEVWVLEFELVKER